MARPHGRRNGASAAAATARGAPAAAEGAPAAAAGAPAAAAGAPAAAAAAASAGADVRRECEKALKAQQCSGHGSKSLRLITDVCNKNPSSVKAIRTYVKICSKLADKPTKAKHLRIVSAHASRVAQQFPHSPEHALARAEALLECQEHLEALYEAKRGLAMELLEGSDTWLQLKDVCERATIAQLFGDSRKNRPILVLRSETYRERSFAPFASNEEVETVIEGQAIPTTEASAKTDIKASTEADDSSGKSDTVVESKQATRKKRQRTKKTKSPRENVMQSVTETAATALSNGVSPNHSVDIDPHGEARSETNDRQPFVPLVDTDDFWTSIGDEQYSNEEGMLAEDLVVPLESLAARTDAQAGAVELLPDSRTDDQTDTLADTSETTETDTLADTLAETTETDTLADTSETTVELLADRTDAQTDTLADTSKTTVGLLTNRTDTSADTSENTVAQTDTFVADRTRVLTAVQSNEAEGEELTARVEDQICPETPVEGEVVQTKQKGTLNSARARRDRQKKANIARQIRNSHQTTPPGFGKGKGLRNPPGENHCFLNCAVQALWHHIGFARDLLSTPSHSDACTCTVCMLKGIFNQFLSSEVEVVDPSGLRTSLAHEDCEGDKKYLEKEMYDASEVLNDILKRLHAGQKNCPGEEICLAHRFFGNDVSELVDCGECNESTRRQKYKTFYQLVNSSQIRQQGLSHAIASAKEQPSTCLRCHTEVPLKRTIGLAPNCALVLVRGRENIADITATVEAIETRINMDGREYTLVSLVCYAYRPSGSHYNSFCLENGQWLMFSDITIETIGIWDNVKARFRGSLEPHVLLYEATASK